MKQFIGLTTGWRKIEYNWRDMALYALAVGSEPDELEYLFERDMKAIPSFGVLPYYNAVNNFPQQPIPYPPNYLLLDAIKRVTDKNVRMGLHAGFEMIMHRPIDPIKGSLVFNGKVREIYDRGDEEKGIELVAEQEVHDEAGNLLCTNISHHFIYGCGGYGGDKAPKFKVDFPDRDPDVVVDGYISKTQNALYRLTGDTNYSHIDPEEARKITDRPFMQGLSSFGFVCRMAIRGVIPKEPERFKRLYVQMRSIAYPDTPVQLQGWIVEEGKMVFKYVDMNTGKAILNNCEFEWD